MQYTISNIHHDTDELDEDVVLFSCDITVTSPQKVFMQLLEVPFASLVDFIEDRHPAFYQFIETTRKSVDGFGPCEARTIELMGENALEQLYSCVEEYFLASTDLVEEYYKIYTERRDDSTEDQTQLMEEEEEEVDDEFTVAALEELSSAAKKQHQRYRDFCEKVTKEIRKVAVEVYPEIEKMEPDELIRFKYLFVSDIQHMLEKIEKLIK